MQKSHLNSTPATELNRLKYPLRMRNSLKGYTVMAVTSWSYRGKSGRECSAAGLTLTFERVCGVWEGGPSRPQTAVFCRPPLELLTDLLPPVCEFLLLPCATCQVSGLSDNSNFHCCTEIIKSPYPRLPFDRTEERAASGRALLHPSLHLLTWNTLLHGFKQH